MPTDKTQITQIDDLRTAIELQTNAIRLQIEKEQLKLEIEAKRVAAQENAIEAEKKRNELLSLITQASILLNSSHDSIIDLLYQTITPNIVNNHRVMITLIESIRQLFVMLADVLSDTDHNQKDIETQVRTLDRIIANEKRSTIERELSAHVRRLDELRVRRANLGLSVGVEVITEIEDIEEKIVELRNLR